MKGVLFADGRRVARVGRSYEFFNSWSGLWELTLKDVEFDEGHKPEELFSKRAMFILGDESETNLYDGHLNCANCAVNHLDGVELRMTFQRKETKFSVGGKKMSFKIFDENSTLKEVQEFCKSREKCQGCPVRGTGFCRVHGRPDKWDLDFLPRFTDQELAWMRVMSAGLAEDNRMWLGREDSRTLYWKIENENTGESRTGCLPRELFPQIQPGQRYELREVLR